MTTKELLSELDVAPASPLTVAEQARSESLLRAVLADREPAVASRVRPARATRGWIVAAAAALSLVVVGGSVVASHYGYFRGSPAAPVAAGPLPAVALASWTASPTVISPTDAAAQSAEKWCLDSMSSGPGASAVAAITSVDQRGSVTSMIITRAGYTFLCIAGPASTGFWEVDGEPGDAVVQLAPTEIREVTSGGHGSGADGFNYVEGLAGSDVASIALTEDGHTMTAAVANGRWTAWWPDASATGEIVGPLTVTAKDGSTSSVSVASIQP